MNQSPKSLCQPLNRSLDNNDWHEHKLRNVLQGGNYHQTQNIDQAEATLKDLGWVKKKY